MAFLDVYRDDALDGPSNMARDEHLLYCAAIAPAAVRIYAWSTATLSLGYFQRRAAIDELSEHLRALPRVRRLTGGGAILHDQEITYSLVASDALPIARRAPADLYALVHEAWRSALLTGGVVTQLAPDSFPLPSPRSGPFFCFARPGRTDLLLGGEKLLGSAQRRIPGRVLQHGSLILGKRFAEHPGAALQLAAATSSGLVDAFLELLAGALQLTPRAQTWTAEQLHQIAARRQRYKDDAWTNMR